MFKLTREVSPIFTSDHACFPTVAVFNPGIARKDGKVYMIYRSVTDNASYTSHLGMATSEDGITFVCASDVPIVSAGLEHTKGAIEDPRIAEIDGVFYITYVAVPQNVLIDGVVPGKRDVPLITSGGLLVTKDFQSFEDWGVITPLNADDKDAVLFPEKIAGKFAMLHRPFFWSQKGVEATEFSAFPVELPREKEVLPKKPTAWLSYSDDLFHWTDHVIMHDLMEESDDKIGPGLPPIRTDRGWLLIYHHVLSSPDGNMYSAKAALLDLADPSKVLSRLPYNILEPEMPYEKEGFVKNVVFPTGGYIDGDRLRVYYGAGDTSVCLATGSMAELFAEFDVYRL